MKTKITFVILICALTISSCTDDLFDQTDGLPNTMSVTLNDSVYTLIDVVGQGSDGYQGAAFCRGTLFGKYLYVHVKPGDTVAVGSVINNGAFDIEYSILYNSEKAIINSGFIITESVSIHRVKGIFSFSSIVNNDTLHFRDGKFNVYIKPSE